MMTTDIIIILIQTQMNHQKQNTFAQRTCVAQSSQPPTTKARPRRRKSKYYKKTHKPEKSSPEYKYNDEVTQQGQLRLAQKIRQLTLPPSTIMLIGPVRGSRQPPITAFGYQYLAASPDKGVDMGRL